MAQKERLVLLHFTALEMISDECCDSLTSSGKARYVLSIISHAIKKARRTSGIQGHVSCRARPDPSQSSRGCPMIERTFVCIAVRKGKGTDNGHERTTDREENLAIRVVGV